jgi:hypothetical protein
MIGSKQFLEVLSIDETNQGIAYSNYAVSVSPLKMYTLPPNQFPGFDEIEDKVPVIVPFNIHAGKSLHHGNEIACMGSLFQYNFTCPEPNSVPVAVDQLQLIITQDLKQR